jgi:hypothetical protein
MSRREPAAAPYTGGMTLRLPARTALTALLCTLAMATLALPAHAQWKWRDANGRVTVSDLPPPRDVPPQNILQRPDATVLRPAAAPASAASAPAPAPAVDRELQARREATVREQAAREKADAARLNEQRAENCRNARAHLSALDSGQRIARFNQKGEREILDDAQRAAESRRARDVITSDCR